MTFRPDIEALRGIAVLLVVAFHVGAPFSAGGFIGVDVFFVLSGYLITGMLVAEKQSTGRIDLLAFYARRARRLLPAALVIVVVSSVATAIMLSPLEQLPASRAALAANVYVENLWQYHRSTDYFAGTHSDPFLHMWSLAVEEQFYLLWPILLTLVTATVVSKHRLGLVLGAVTLLSLSYVVWLTPRNESLAFFGPIGRAWEFGIGGLLAVRPLFRARSGTAAVTLATIGLLLIVGVAGAPTSLAQFPAVLVVISVVGTGLLLVAGEILVAPRWVRRALAPLQAIGGRSYAWYLWHWPALVLAAAAFPEMTLASKVFVAVMTLVLADVTYRLVENPIRRRPSWAAKPFTTLGVALGCTCVAAGISVAWHGWASALAATPPHAESLAAARDLPSVYRLGCVPDYDEDEVVECEFGDTTSATTVALFGDSHAAHWTAGVAAVAATHGWRLVTILKPACPAAAVPGGTARIATSGRMCVRWREEAIRRLGELRPDVVIMASASSYVEASGRPSFGMNRTSVARWEQGTRETVATLAGTGIPVLLVHDTPSLGIDIPRCVSRAVHASFLYGSDCATEPRKAIRIDVREAEIRAVVGLEGVRTLDVTTALCQSTCPAVVNGAIMYSDAHHLTNTAARYLASRIADVLVPMTGGQLVGNVRASPGKTRLR